MAKYTITKMAIERASEGAAISAVKHMIIQEAVNKGLSKVGLERDIVILNTGCYNGKGWTAKARLVVEARQ